MLNPDWLPKVPMRRIHWHWTAGTNQPNATDRKAYHLLIDGDGNWHKGVPGIELNSGGIKPGYAAHTLNANSDAIGISLCGMAGAVEAPFNPGRWPIRPAQIDALVEGCRILGQTYAIPITRKTMLSHAEVQPTLGIAQRNKWDWTRLPDEVTPLRGGIAIGDWIRARIALAGDAPVDATTPLPTGAMLRVTASTLNARNSPNGEIVGGLPLGVEVELLTDGGDWLFVRTPGGFDVWISAKHVQAVDGPQPQAPTAPSPVRLWIAQQRKALDELEALI